MNDSLTLFLTQSAVYLALLTVFLLVWSRFGPYFTASRIKEKIAIDSLNTRIQELESEVAKLQTYIDFLLAQLANSYTPVPDEGDVSFIPNTAELIKRDVLLICGDMDFCNSDRRALRRSGLQFLRLMYPTAENIGDELRRRRSDGTLYPIVHFGAHAGSKGIKLYDGHYITGDALSEIVDGIETIYLNTCSNVAIADKLSDIVTYVIVIYEDITNDLAETFATEFYTQVWP